MGRKVGEQLIVSEHVWEIRYVPTGGFLDKRGLLADYVQQSNQFPYWSIDTNVVRFQDGSTTHGSTRLIIGFKLGNKWQAFGRR